MSAETTLREREKDAEQIGDLQPLGSVRLSSGDKRDLDEGGRCEAFCMMDGEKFVVQVVVDE